MNVHPSNTQGSTVQNPSIHFASRTTTVRKSSIGRLLTRRILEKETFTFPAIAYQLPPTKTLVYYRPVNVNAQVMSDKVLLKGVVFCDCSQEVCTERCLKRGAAGSGRTDDNKEVLIKRHETYMNNTLPIIHHYEEKGMVYKVNSMNSPEKVFEDMQKILAQIGW